MSDNAANAGAAFALLVVNYGSSLLLEKNLSGLDLAGAGGHIVIVDNFTSTAEAANVNALAARYGWTVLALQRNWGFGAAVNAGAKTALDHGAETIVVLNPDATMDQAEMVRLVAAVGNDPGLMACPLIKTSHGDIWFDGMELYTATGRVASNRRREQPAGPHQPWLTGACFAISQDLWLRTGGFDEDYFLYWEDVDFSLRVLRAGGRLGVLHDVVAIHDPGGTQTGLGGAGTKSESYYFYNIRNRLVYAAKHLDGQQLRRWIYATPRVSYEILCGGGRRQLLTSPAPLRALTQGVLEGLRLVIRIRRRAREKPKVSAPAASAAGIGSSGTVRNR